MKNTSVQKLKGVKVFHKNSTAHAERGWTPACFRLKQHMILMGQVCAQSFLVQTKDLAKPDPMSKVTVWLALENGLLTTNTCPMQGCQRQLRVIFYSLEKQQNAEVLKPGTTSEEQNCQAPSQAMEAKILRQKEVHPQKTECEGWKCALLLSLTDTSLGAMIRTCLL